MPGNPLDHVVGQTLVSFRVADKTRRNGIGGDAFGADYLCHGARQPVQAGFRGDITQSPQTGSPVQRGVGADIDDAARPDASGGAARHTS